MQPGADAAGKGRLCIEADGAARADEAQLDAVAYGRARRTLAQTLPIRQGRGIYIQTECLQLCKAVH